MRPGSGCNEVRPRDRLADRRRCNRDVPALTLEQIAGQLALAVDRPWTLAMPGPATIGAVVGIAVLCTALAYILYFRLLASAGATNLLLVTFLIPVSAILLGVAFLGEVLLPRHVGGMALIGLGLAAIDGRAWRSITQKRGARRRPA